MLYCRCLLTAGRALVWQCHKVRRKYLSSRVRRNVLMVLGVFRGAENGGNISFWKFVRSAILYLFRQSKVSNKSIYCHRSGEYIPEGEGKRVPRHNVSDRCGFQCTAFAFTQTDTATGVVTVTYCLKHYLHDNLLSRLPLPQESRQRVKELLENGTDIDQIPDTIRCKLCSFALVRLYY